MIKNYIQKDTVCDPVHLLNNLYYFNNSDVRADEFYVKQ